LARTALACPPASAPPPPSPLSPYTTLFRSEVRHAPALVAEPGVQLLLVLDGGQLGDLGADALAERLGVIVQLQDDLAAAAVQRDRGDLGGPLGGRAEQRPQRQGAAQVDVRVVLPGEADAAEDLDGVAGGLHAGVERDD